MTRTTLQTIARIFRGTDEPTATARDRRRSRRFQPGRTVEGLEMRLSPSTAVTGLSGPGTVMTNGAIITITTTNGGDQTPTTTTPPSPTPAPTTTHLTAPEIF